MSRTDDPNAVLSLYHLLDQSVLADPYPLFHRLRREDPVHWDPFLHSWVVTRYADVLEVLHTFSADRTPSPEQLTAMGLSRFNPIAQLMVKQMLFMDAPAHTRLRGLASKAFTPARVEQLRGHIQEIVNRLLDQIQQKGSMEVVADLAEPLPAIVTAEMLGVPVEDRGHLKTWSANFAEMLGNFQHNPDNVSLMLQTVEEMTEYFRDMVQEIKKHPREGLIHSLLTAEIEGDRLRDEEVVANSIVTMVGGQETTTSLIANGLLTLLRNPEQMALLRGNLSLVPSAVEEMLRYESPSQHTARLAPSDRDLGGKKIGKRQAVIAVMAAANRDPEKFPEPDRFDITRKDNRHLAFGYAAHFCFGAPLARLEAQIAFDSLLRRFPVIRLEPQQLTWRTNLGLRCLTAMKVSFDDGAAGNERTKPQARTSAVKANATDRERADTDAARRKLVEQLLSGKTAEMQIPRRAASQAAPLSFAQEQIWLHCQIAPESPLYNEPVILTRSGALDVPALERSLTEIIRRHEAWRTNFDVVDERPRQVIRPAVEFTLEVVDLRNFPESDRKNQADRLAAEQSKRPFNLKDESLVRAVVVRLDEAEYQINLTLHHIIFDGLSIYRVFLPELMVCYRAFSEGKRPALRELPIQYADFAAWQRNASQNEEDAYARQMTYWEKKLGTDVPALQLPTDRPRPAVQSFRGAMHAFRLPAELSHAIRDLGRKQGATPFMILLAAFTCLLHRYSGQTDLIVGTVSAGRKQSGLESLLGCFQNPLALRMDVAHDPTFLELLRRVRETTLEALSHDDVPFGSLVKELLPDRDFSRNPLLQVLISLAPSTPMSEPGWESTQMGIDVGVAKFDLDLELDDRPDGIRGRFVYNTDLFDHATIARTVGHWETLLRGIVAQPEQRVSALPLLTESEKTQFEKWNDTKTEFPSDSCIHQLIEAQVERTPHAVAVQHGKRSLTYRELNRRANQLAHYLRKRGVSVDVPVGICLESSFEMAVSLLGVLKAGAACVPMDPKYPAERLAYMLEDAQAPVVIAQPGALPVLPQSSTAVIGSAQDWEEISKEGDNNLTNSSRPDSLAYIIYTSGSTGKPRGVLLTHRGLVNHNTAAIKLYGLTSADRVLQFSSVSFDIAVEEILPTWMSGAALALKTATMPLAAREFMAWIRRRGITVLDLPTAYWHELVHQLSESNGELPPDLRMVIVGGEKASVSTLQKWRALARGRVRWVNTYGPTEASVIVTAYEPPAGELPATLPIGRPIANTRAYILDGNLQQVPVGVAGELYVAGPGVARGYLNRPEQTQQKFVAEPWGIADPRSSDANARLYKTGDMARFLPSGDIEFLGRTDDQVKIHGFRVELGEIEAILAQHPAVKQPIVVAREDGRGEKILVAYYEAAGQASTVAQLRSFLKHKLPEYMLPSAFVRLAKMPLTPNGKVNRKALPEPQPGDSVVTDGEFAAAKDEVESRLVRIWESVLGKRPIGIQQNFFELGGHSLLAVRLMHRIEQSFGKAMPITTLFQAPTIEQLAELLRREGWSPSWSSLVTIQPNGSKPPFFCVHGAGGTVIIYRDLALAMGEDQPIYGLQAQGLDGKQPLLTRVEEMAAHYLKEIRAVQPSGPYFIGGLSFGGTVAYEMAQQLRAAGEEVGLLALFDTFAGGYESNHELLLKLWRLPLFEKIGYLGRKTTQYGKTAWRRLTRGFLPEALKKVRRGIHQAGAAYSPQVYAEPVVLFRASKKSLRGVDDPFAGWKELAGGGLEIFEIPGDHVGIMGGSAVRILAKHLKSCLESAQSNRVQEEVCAN